MTMAMAKFAVLLLALLASFFLLQVAVAVESSPAEVFHPNVNESTEVVDVPDVAKDEIATGRSLWETKSGSKTCRTASKCHRWFNKPGCCNHWCVNLSNNNKHCGKCGKCCPKDTVCRSGKCKKESSHKPPVHEPQCGPKKPCGKKGQTCCYGRCADLIDDTQNCGQCGKKCGSGSFCCKGKCKTNSNQHCGKWGKTCHFGSVCCKGECEFVHKSDHNNCGACGRTCPKGVKCNYGMCGYGH